MTRKTDAALASGPEVQPTGMGGSHVIDPATGLPVQTAVLPAVELATELAAEPARKDVTVKKEPGK